MTCNLQLQLRRSLQLPIIHPVPQRMGRVLLQEAATKFASLQCWRTLHLDFYQNSQPNDHVASMQSGTKEGVRGHARIISILVGSTVNCYIYIYCSCNSSKHDSNLDANGYNGTTGYIPRDPVLRQIIDTPN